MLRGPLYSLSDIARETGKEGNRKLLRLLTRHYKINAVPVGRDVVYDQEGHDALVEAVRVWDSRPKLCEIAAAS